MPFTRSPTTPTQIRHSDNLDHKTSPTREMLRPLSSTRVRIILLPCETSLLPALVHRLHEIGPEFDVYTFGLLLMRSSTDGHILFKYVSKRAIAIGATLLSWSDRTHIYFLDDQIIHVHPYWTPPVILVRVVEFIPLTQRTDAVLTPQFLRIGDEIEHRAHFFTLWVYHAGHEWEDADVSLVTDVDAFIVVINGRVTIGLLVLVPMQVVNVLGNGIVDLGEIWTRLVDLDVLGDSCHDARHHAYPAYQICVKLAWMRWLRSRVVV